MRRLRRSAQRETSLTFFGTAVPRKSSVRDGQSVAARTLRALGALLSKRSDDGARYETFQVTRTLRPLRPIDPTQFKTYFFFEPESRSVAESTAARRVLSAAAFAPVRVGTVSGGLRNTK